MKSIMSTSSLLANFEFQQAKFKREYLNYPESSIWSLDGCSVQLLNEELEDSVNINLIATIRSLVNSSKGILKRVLTIKVKDYTINPDSPVLVLKDDYSEEIKTFIKDFIYDIKSINTNEDCDVETLVNLLLLKTKGL